MKFTADIKNSLFFTGLYLGIENRENRKIEDLQVGESFGTTYIALENGKLDFSIWGDTYKAKRIGYSPGIYEVVDKRIDSDSVTYITISIQDLEIYLDDGNIHNPHKYIVNGVIEFRVCEGGLFPRKEEPVVDPESMRMPREELNFFMMDALHGSEFEGRRTFFSEEAVAEECLIINSEEEFRQAYKGDKELPSTGINFDYCTLVIGRTYGEHGGITYGGHELIDNGDSYQLNVTLNNNVNPDYCYTAAFTDIYFWNIYLKKEKKPVVFNRIRQDVTIDPLVDANSRLVGRWRFLAYFDGDHWCNDSLVGNHYIYNIEFKADGTVEGRINGTDDFSCNYMMPYIGKRAYYEDAVDHGIIKLWDWKNTNVANDNPLSERIAHIVNATQIRLLMTYNLTLYVSPDEFYAFRRDNQ
ncbi:MAG: hypothetical protein IKO86_05680 [Prevotella sp.]|nr:hypothetical protein [Prevotella sp.]